MSAWRCSTRSTPSPRSEVGEATQLAGPVEPDQDLAEEPLLARRLAPGAERLDGRVEDDPRGIDRREGTIVDALGRREQATARHDIGIARPARDGVEADVRPRPGPRRQASARRQQLDHRGDVLIGLGQPSPEQAEAGRGAAEDRRDDRLRTAVDELDDPAVARQRGLDRPERVLDGRRLPAPRDAQRRPGQPVDRQQQGGLAAEDPGGRVVGDRESLEARAHRRLAEDEADPGRLRRPAVGVRVVVEPGEAGRAGQAQVRRRRPLAEAPQVLAEACLDRSLGAGVEPLDEPANAPEGLLEREPRIALPELRPALRADVAGRHPERGVPTRTRAEAAGGQDRVEQRQPQGRHDRRSPQVALDALEDGAETDELAAGVEVEQLIGQASPRRRWPGIGRGAMLASRRPRRRRRRA